MDTAVFVLSWAPAVKRPSRATAWHSIWRAWDRPRDPAECWSVASIRAWGPLSLWGLVYVTSFTACSFSLLSVQRGNLTEQLWVGLRLSKNDSFSKSAEVGREQSWWGSTDKCFHSYAKTRVNRQFIYISYFLEEEMGRGRGWLLCGFSCSVSADVSVGPRCPLGTMPPPGIGPSVPEGHSKNMEPCSSQVCLLLVHPISPFPFTQSPTTGSEIG